jgi:hypothetical protein
LIEFGIGGSAGPVPFFDGLGRGLPVMASALIGL